MKRGSSRRSTLPSRSGLRLGKNVFVSCQRIMAACVSVVVVPAPCSALSSYALACDLCNLPLPPFKRASTLVSVSRLALSVIKPRSADSVTPNSTVLER